jgi:hypothetical protein
VIIGRLTPSGTGFGVDLNAPVIEEQEKAKTEEKSEA